MTDPTPDDEPVPTQHRTPSSDAASAPPRRGFTLRGRTWVYGATLAAAGVLAGGGVTYAVVGAAPAVQSRVSAPDGSGQHGGPAGAPPAAPSSAGGDPG